MILKEKIPTFGSQRLKETRDLLNTTNLAVAGLFEEFLKSDASKTEALENRIAELEKKIEALENNGKGE